ncbi:MAG: hypothetical protein QOJ70_142 [Acidobacteriota bacterium]|jgi:hypothetical protein|nr:hypothetical protein [Acidobacteriota bacterium]
MMIDKAIDTHGDDAAETARLARTLEMQRIGKRAVHKAQAENRRLGIPNWYSIGGVLISDQELDRLKLSADIVQNP